MELEELKKKSSAKVLLRGESGSGKTLNACKVALAVLDKGYNVRYIDMESEGSDTLVKLVETGGYDEDVVSGLEYVEVDSYDEFMSGMTTLGDVDLLVIDPMDHKHTYVLREVADAKTKSDADWNEYPQIYDQEKKIMSAISDMNTNVVCTLDPDSGKDSKPKGAQTNIHGYYGVVVDLYRQGDDWAHKVDNWIGRGDLIGGEINNVEVHQAITKEVLDRL